MHPFCFLTCRDEKPNLTRTSGFCTYFIIIQPAKSVFVQVKINSVGLWKTISGLYLSPQVFPEYRCSIRSQSALPTNTWTIYLFIKRNWNERNKICIYITPFIYRGYQSSLQTLHRNHFTTAEEWAALHRKMEALHPLAGNLGQHSKGPAPEKSRLSGLIQQWYQTHLLNELGWIL